jgi:hypothetical protein
VAVVTGMGWHDFRLPGRYCAGIKASHLLKSARMREMAAMYCWGELMVELVEKSISYALPQSRFSRSIVTNQSSPAMRLSGVGGIGQPTS